MTEEQFDARLKALASLVGKDETQDQFNEGYEALLDEIQALPGGRFAMAERLRKLCDHQLAYLMNSWIQLDKKEWSPRWVMGKA
jgi:hypothetical protein